MWRTSSRKPADDLLATFRKQFPEVGATTALYPLPCLSQTVKDPAVVNTSGNHERSASLSHDNVRDLDRTPRATDPWRFTPSMMDQNSSSFALFANQLPGCLPPTPRGSSNTIFHPQAGDPHTPTLSTLGMNFGSPLSMPVTEGGAMMNNGTHTQAGVLDPLQLSHFNPYLNQPQQQPGPPPPHPARVPIPQIPAAAAPPPPAPPPHVAVVTSFPPSTFIQPETLHDPMDEDISPIKSDPAHDVVAGLVADHSQSTSPLMSMPSLQAISLPASSAQGFRFHATLNASTAMIKRADEIPVTYLNKGQAYSISILDTASPLSCVSGQHFRTFIRISFDDHQRQKPSTYWGLWKEGRGTSEAHQRGGVLQAVEYVETAQAGEGEDKRTRVVLERASFDGFCVTWEPAPNAAVECTIAVRFNFLSTDFSHSKGVKGILVRLCVKTSVLTATTDNAVLTSASAAATSALAKSCTPPMTYSEISYCKVKLFRDHGAERKLSNDVAHIRKTMDKIRQQIMQAENGVKEFGKRKRLASASRNEHLDLQQKPSKVSKHRRTWSISSASSAGAGRVSSEEDVHYKLQTLQDMFTSTRPVSALSLRGEPGDDPDLHPVTLPGEPNILGRINTTGSWATGENSMNFSGSMVSPSASPLSLSSSVGRRKDHWADYQPGEFSDGGAPARKASDRPTRVQTRHGAGQLNGWIEALGVDSSYRPPPEHAVKPVACVYVRLRDRTPPSAQGPSYHRAVYLMRRQLDDFVCRVSAKLNIDAAKVMRTVRVFPQPGGLEVEMDDDVVRELPDGQDMMLEIVESRSPSSVASLIAEPWDAMSIDWLNDAPTSRHGYELRFFF